MDYPLKWKDLKVGKEYYEKKGYKSIKYRKSEDCLLEKKCDLEPWICSNNCQQTIKGLRFSEITKPEPKPRLDLVGAYAKIDNSAYRLVEITVDDNGVFYSIVDSAYFREEKDFLAIFDVRNPKTWERITE